jgi:hypothetical protein
VLSVFQLYTQQNAVLGYNGRTDWADWANPNGFLRNQCSDFKQKLKKIRVNPPDPPNPFFHCIPKPLSVVYITKVSQKYHNIPKSEIHIPKSEIVYGYFTEIRSFIG